MSGHPTISIVSIVLNDAVGMQRTAQSIIEQSDVPLEWIVIDGGSVDGTTTVLQQLRPHIRHLVSEPDGGIYDAMNKGLRLSNGDYVVFMNAGDSFSGPHCLRDVSQALRRSIEELELPDILLSGARLIFPSGNSYYKPPRPPSYVKHSLPGNHQSTFVRTSLHKDNEFPTDYKICGDYAAIASMISRGATVLTADIEVARRDTSLNSTAVRSQSRIYEECKRVQREVLSLPEEWIRVSHRKRFLNQEGRRMLTRMNSTRLGSWVASSLDKLSLTSGRSSPSGRVHFYRGAQDLT
ncbi:glycosyltransferase family 2 protein [Pseudorhizobium pelagicum]|uniref:glycosyltransferase family 2 protein n=1 Tax=Pseudorhizobium pelagicum TaxID=1509405 RepID=UPI0009DD8EBC